MHLGANHNKPRRAHEPAVGLLRLFSIDSPTMPSLEVDHRPQRPHPAGERLLCVLNMGRLFGGLSVPKVE